jgi:hypothetical protein
MQRISKTTLISLSVLTASAMFIVGAQAQSLTSAPEPSPEIESLTKALSGEWSLSVKFEPSALAPNGLASMGEETWRPGPGGFTLLEEEHLRMPEGDLFLLGVVWWNTATKSLHGMECQNLLPYTCDVKGAQRDITMSWDSKQFVIDEMETSKSGKKSVWHEVWSDITSDSFTQTGEYGDPGKPRKRLFTIHATRLPATQSNNDGLGSSNANHKGSNDVRPTAEMRSLTKALKGNWSTTYEFAPGGPFPTGGHRHRRRKLANRPRWIRFDRRGARACALRRNVPYRISMVGQDHQQLARDALQQFRSRSLRFQYILQQFSELGWETADDQSAISAEWQENDLARSLVRYHCDFLHANWRYGRGGWTAEEGRYNSRY